MRRIERRAVPAALVTWREQHKDDPNFGYALLDAATRNAVLTSLIEEQRGLCAYTGIRIDDERAHLEHIYPQAHCTLDEQTSYENLSACYPAPNAPRQPFGAHKKDAWPPNDRRQLFVTPYAAGCERRFAFELSGKVKAAADGDKPATETISRLGLDCKALTDRRKAAIDAAIGRSKRTRLRLTARHLRERLARLEAAEAGPGMLDEFAFVLLQAIPKQLQVVEAIRKQRRRR